MAIHQDCHSSRADALFLKQAHESVSHAKSLQVTPSFSFGAIGHVPVKQ